MRMFDWSADKDAAGGFGNTILYRMVAENPTHDDEDVIKGKMQIIGRTYAASVTRGAGKKGNEQDGFLDHLVKDIKSIGKELDEHVLNCNKYRRVDVNNLHYTLNAHSFLDMQIVNSIKDWRTDNKEPSNRDVHSRISFVSKYLHFHAPMAVFIFDSIAEKKLKEKGLKGFRARIPEEWKYVNTKYAKYCLRMLEFIRQENYGTAWTPRQVDGHLLGYMEKST